MIHKKKKKEIMKIMEIEITEIIEKKNIIIESIKEIIKNFIVLKNMKI